MAIFQKEVQTTGISDRMILGGWEFEALLTISEKNGNAAAIHRGRILSLEISCCGEVIAFYDGGIWYQTPAEDFEEGKLARELFIEKWNRPDALKEASEDQKLF